MTLAAAKSWLNIDLQRGVLRWLHDVAHRRLRTRVKDGHLRTGERGEFEAYFFLESLGYRVVERRWVAREVRGDLDLVAWEGDTLAFVEVKSRRKRDQTPAALAVDEAKRQMLRRMAGAYLARMHPEEELLVRFDIVSVYLLETSVECELVRDAFTR